MPVKPTNQPMCCVSIAYQDYILPADKGMKLVQLLQNAMKCQKNYDDKGYTYTLDEEPDVSYEAVKAAQIRMSKPDTKPAQLALGHEPLKLTHVKRSA